MGGRRTASGLTGDAQRARGRPLDAVAGIVGFEGPKENLLAAIAARSQLYGLISFGLFGQTRWMTRDDAALFSATNRIPAEAVGLVESEER